MIAYTQISARDGDEEDAVRAEHSDEFWCQEVATSILENWTRSICRGGNSIGSS
jgi:hypothetical protein